MTATQLMVCLFLVLLVGVMLLGAAAMGSRIFK